MHLSLSKRRRRRTVLVVSIQRRILTEGFGHEAWHARLAIPKALLAEGTIRDLEDENRYGMSPEFDYGAGTEHDGTKYIRRHDEAEGGRLFRAAKISIHRFISLASSAVECHDYWKRLVAALFWPSKTTELQRHTIC